MFNCVYIREYFFRKPSLNLKHYSGPHRSTRKFFATKLQYIDFNMKTGNITL